MESAGESSTSTPGYSRIYTVLFFVAATMLLGFASFRILKPFAASIAWAIVLAVGFNRPWEWLVRRLPNRRGFAAILATTAIALLVLLPAGLFSVSIATQAMATGNSFSQRLGNQNVDNLSDLRTFPMAARALDWVIARTGISGEDLDTRARDFLKRASASVATRSAALVLGIFDVLLSFFMTLFLLFFFLRDGAEMSAAALELLPIDRAARQAMKTSVGGMLGAIFRGSLLCALAQGLAGGLGWWITGLPSPALAGAAMAILSLVPFGGTAIVWIPGSIWLWTQDHHGMAIFLFLWGALVVSFVADNVLKPMLIGGSAELSTLVVFLGVFGGLAVYGLLGIFIGPIVLVLATGLLEVLRTQAQVD